jgi:hypothetical protein
MADAGVCPWKSHGVFDETGTLRECKMTAHQAGVEGAGKNKLPGKAGPLQRPGTSAEGGPPPFDKDASQIRRAVLLEFVEYVRQTRNLKYANTVRQAAIDHFKIVTGYSLV